MSEAETGQLLERLAEGFPVTRPRIDEVLQGGLRARRRRRALRAACAAALVAAIGAGLAGSWLDPAHDVPPVASPPTAPPGTHWVGGNGALVAVPDDGSATVAVAPFVRAEHPSWRIPYSGPDGKPVDAMSHGPVCGADACRGRIAVPASHVYFTVEAHGPGARVAVRRVLGSLTFVSAAEAAALR